MYIFITIHIYMYTCTYTQCILYMCLLLSFFLLISHSKHVYIDLSFWASHTRTLDRTEVHTSYSYMYMYIHVHVMLANTAFNKLHVSTTNIIMI